MARVPRFNKMEECESVRLRLCHFLFPSEQFNDAMNQRRSLELEEDITEGPEWFPRGRGTGTL